MIALGRTSQIIYQVRLEGRKALSEPEANAVCMEYGIPVAAFELAKNEDDVVKFAEKLGYPVVLKIVSPDVLHKSDVGGVIVNLGSNAEVRRAYVKILENAENFNPAARVTGVLVQEMAPKSTEVIVGAIKDPQFGQTLMFGLGGIFVELLKDVSLKIAPITEAEAKEMITGVKAYPILNGYRNMLPADVDAITAILLNTSRLVMENPEIKELDLNPIMVYEKGAKTVDARIILE